MKSKIKIINTFVIILLFLIVRANVNAQSKSLSLNSGAEADEYIWEYNNPSWVTGDDWTMEAWVKFDDFSNNENHIFRLGGQLYVNWQGYVLTTVGSYTEQALSTNTWYHFAYVRTATGTKVYLNGSLIISGGADPGSATMLYIGCYSGDNPNTHLSGQIDEFRLWNDARTQEEINKYNRVELTGLEDDLLIYYNFNNGSGNSNVTDRAGGDDNGYLENMESSDWNSTGAPLSKVFYVADSGSDLNDGISESSAWRSIEFAATQAVAGDTVYVKAGTYNNENVVVSNSGTSGAKIIFEGYKNTPGDITNTEWWSYPDALDATEMPLLIGNSRSTGGSAFSMLTKKYILIKNFQIKNYSDGILLSWSGSAGNNSAENIIVENIGPGNSPSGVGITAVYGSGFSINNCTIINADGQGISLTYTTNSTIDGCKVYCDEPTDGTDYYIIITSNDGGSGAEPFANNNTVKNCYIQRADSIPHGGAGIGMKGTCENNIIENCTAKNLKNAAFYVRHSGANNNEIKNCIAIGGNQGDGFIVRDGAHHNKFINCKTDGCGIAVGFYSAGEDSTALTTGNDNEFYNCLFSKTKYAQMYIGSSDYVKETKNNSFINCVFDDGTYLFNAVQNSSNNSMANCIVTNIDNYKNGSASLTFNYTNSDFYQNGFSAPAGSNLITSDPLFVNLANADYHLQSGSPCINAGLADTAGLGLPSTDYEGNARIVGGTIDMGIYESTVLPQNYALEFNTDTDSTKNEGVVVLTGYSGLTKCTIEAWIKPYGYENGSNEENVILRHSTQGESISIYDNDSHNLSWETFTAQGNTTIPLNVWTHIALVAENDSLIAMYVNGESETVSGSKNISMPNGDIVIGNYNMGCTASELRFIGAIDELRIWDDIRTQTEVQNNKNKILTGSESNLIGYWDFNDGSGTTLTNKVSGGANGTLMNMEVNGEASDWVTGVGSLAKQAANKNTEKDNAIPVKYELSQNYPNPFNPTTTINFSLPVTQNVKLTVFDILGEKVAELVNGKLEAGNHSVTFNAKNLSSGIYIYKITAGKFVSVKKLMLLK